MIIYKKISAILLIVTLSTLIVVVIVKHLDIKRYDRPLAAGNQHAVSVLNSEGVDCPRCATKLSSYPICDKCAATIQPAGTLDLVIAVRSKLRDLPGRDFRVYEVDSSYTNIFGHSENIPNSYEVYAASFDKKWVYLGNGHGITDFDLYGLGDNQVRYIRIVALDGKSIAEPLSIDAVEMFH